MPPLISADELRAYIRDVPDFPKPGILFKDITPLLGDYKAFQASIEGIAEHYAEERIDAIAAAEARGFLFAAPLALALKAGLVPIRKPGKLPHAKVSFDYQLEYGSDRLEMHSDALQPGHRILMVDDVLATGGTMKTCCRLVESTGAEIAGCAFLIELKFLNGRSVLSEFPVFSLISY